MKVLIISLCTQGIGVMREHFIYYCKRFAQKVDLYCITNDNVTNEELGAIDTLNLRYVHSDLLGYFSISKILKVKKYIERIKPDIIYVFTHHTSNLFLSPVLKNYKVIYQVHDPNPHIGTSFIERKIITIQLKQFAKFSKKLVVAANDIKKQTLSVVCYDSKNIEVIPLAVLDNYINEDVKEAKDDFDLLFYGKIKKYKGIDCLIDALNILNKEGICPKVKIVGGKEVLKTFPDIKSIPKNVAVEGYAADDLLISYIKKAKALVLPYHEATGTMAIGQSFYYGTPVIATDVGCFPEYVNDGGLICEHSNPVELAKTIKIFLFDTKLQNVLSKNAKRNYYEHFTIDNAINMHISVFNKVVNNE